MQPKNLFAVFVVALLGLTALAFVAAGDEVVGFADVESELELFKFFDSFGVFCAFVFFFCRGFVRDAVFRVF